MNPKRIFVLAAAALALTATATIAQPDKGKTWTGNVAGGYVLTLGETGDKINNGWNIQGGATFRPESWPVGIFFEGGYTDMGIKQEFRELLRVDNGGVDIWNVGAGVMWAPRLKGTVGFYINAGVGAYRLGAELTDNAVFQGIICDPWWPWTCRPGLIPGEVVLESRSTTELGYNVGIGVTFELGSLSQLYLEARYHTVDVQGRVEWMPIVFGFRW